jgi:hypothetical protein
MYPEPEPCTLARSLPHPFHHFSPASETEAYCILIANVNYREGSMTLYDRTITYPRGDSIKSLDTGHAFSAGAKPAFADSS